MLCGGLSCKGATDDTRPPSGTVLSVSSVNQCSITFDWSPAPSLPFDHGLWYRIYYAASDFDATFQALHATTSPWGGELADYTLFGLLPGTTYTVAVVAMMVNRWGNLFSRSRRLSRRPVYWSHRVAPSVWIVTVRAIIPNPANNNNMG